AGISSVASSFVRAGGRRGSTPRRVLAYHCASVLRPPSDWIEIALESAGSDVRVTASGSNMARPPSHTLGVPREALDAFAKEVGRAVELGIPLRAQVLEQAQRLHEALLQGEVRDVVTRL